MLLACSCAAVAGDSKSPVATSGDWEFSLSAGPAWEERQLLGGGRIEIGNEGLLQLDPFGYSNPFAVTGEGPVSTAWRAGLHPCRAVS